MAQSRFSVFITRLLMLAVAFSLGIQHVQAQQYWVKNDWDKAKQLAYTQDRFICLFTAPDGLPEDLPNDSLLSAKYICLEVSSYRNLPEALVQQIGEDSSFSWNCYALTPSGIVMLKIHPPAPESYIAQSLGILSQPQNRQILQDELFRMGRRDAGFLSQFFDSAKWASSIPPDIALSFYCRAIQSRPEADTRLFHFIVRYAKDIHLDAYNYVLTHRQAYANEYGSGAVDQYLAGAAIMVMNTSITDEATMRHASEVMNTIGDKELRNRFLEVKAKWYYMHDRLTDMMHCIDSLDMPDYGFYEQAAYAICLATSKRELLGKAGSYVLRSMNARKTPVNTLIYARILYKMGETENAQVFDLASEKIAASEEVSKESIARVLESYRLAMR